VLATSVVLALRSWRLVPAPERVRAFAPAPAEGQVAT
jgi:hypothetical protein